MSGLYMGFAAVAIALLATACLSAEPKPSAPQLEEVRAVGGIILKPKVAVADSAALMRLIKSRLAAPENVKYLRLMSGDAHVLQVIPPATSSDIAAIVAQLAATGLFEYVEEDRMMTIRRP